MTRQEFYREPVVANVGDELLCPGCREWVRLDGSDGWRGDGGYTCKPISSTHSDHIETLEGGNA